MLLIWAQSPEQDIADHRGDISHYGYFVSPVSWFGVVTRQTSNIVSAYKPNISNFPAISDSKC